MLTHILIMPISDAEILAKTESLLKAERVERRKGGGSGSHGELRLLQCANPLPPPSYHKASDICIECVSVGHRVRWLTCRAHMQRSFTSIPMSSESNCLASTLALHQ
jgi:hypothetical protein